MPPINPLSQAGAAGQNPNIPQGAGTEYISEAVETVEKQCRGTAKILGSLKKYPGVQTLQQLAQQGRKDPAKGGEVSRLTSTEGTESIQMTYSGSAVKVDNTLTGMIKPKTGFWIFGSKEGPIRTEIRNKVNNAKSKSIKEYYGPKGPATASLDSSYAITEYTTAVLKAKTPKDIERAASKWLPKAIAPLTKLQNKINPDNVKQVAKELGTIKGIMDATSARIDVKSMGYLDTLIKETEEFDNAKGVTQRVAEEIIRNANQSPQAQAA